MRPSAHSAGEPAEAGLIEMERLIDRLLRDRVWGDPFSASLQLALNEWSRAVWAVAELQGASIPDLAELDPSIRLARRAVFVCGAARSGTSLLRDLLDGHPELVVIPNESAFYAGLERRLMNLAPHRHRAFLGCRWLERLADAPPFWLLGSTAPDGSPYVDFARSFAGWWRIVEQRPEARMAAWPLASFALAYAQWLGGGRLLPSARMWVEKSPGNERSLTRIWRDFPAAKVIQIVRRPEAVLASIKRMTAPRWSRRRTLAHIIGEMAPSYWIAAGAERRLPPDRYCLVRYEDLTANPDAAMLRIARFLGIEPRPSLLRPTVTGRPASNNSSFGTGRPDPRDVLDPVDRALLAVAIARPAAKLGYVPADVPAASHRIVA